MRALQRASEVRWAAGYEARKAHIKALETSARQMAEDHEEWMEHAEARFKREMGRIIDRHFPNNQ